MNILRPCKNGKNILENLTKTWNFVRKKEREPCGMLVDVLTDVKRTCLTKPGRLDSLVSKSIVLSSWLLWKTILYSNHRSWFIQA